MDTTGSMGSWIQECKTKIKDIIKDIKNEFKLIKIRIGFIGYKDHCDKENLD
jgi:tRNA-dihydrouridine synthase